MWTNNIISKTLDNGILNVQVSFTSGENTAVRSFTARSLTELKRKIRQASEELAEAQTLEQSLLLGEIDVKEEAPVAQTPAEIAEQAWFRAYRRWVQVKKDLIDTGVVPANNTKVASLLQEVKNGLKVGYVDKM